MSLTLRRTVSFATVVATVVATALIYTRLPGADGTLSELHWILSRPPPERQLRRAGGLLVIAEEQDSGAEARYLKGLLKSDNSLVVDSALEIMLLRWMRGIESWENVNELFNDWFVSASDEQRWAHVQPIVGLSGMLLARVDTLSLESQVRVLQREPEYLRWHLASMVHPDKRFRRSLEPPLLESPDPAIQARLDRLDGWFPIYEQEEQPSWWPRIDAADWVVWAVDDPFPQVRWAAGLVLALCRDERGLHAAYDWLQNDPNAPASANQVLDQLFGPDWRKPFEK